MSETSSRLVRIARPTTILGAIGALVAGLLVAVAPAANATDWVPNNATLTITNAAGQVTSTGTFMVPLNVAVNVTPAPPADWTGGAVSLQGVCVPNGSISIAIAGGSGTGQATWMPSNIGRCTVEV
ncbi:MAG: hypothetical protein ACKOW5_14710, partial [Actinomycetales bacterium]